jgi:hypothetical protein
MKSIWERSRPYRGRLGYLDRINILTAAAHTRSSEGFDGAGVPKVLPCK